MNKKDCIIIKEGVIITHRNGRKEFLTHRKYLLLKIANIIFRFSILTIVITTVILFALSFNTPEDAFVKIALAEFGTLTLSGVCRIVLR